MYLVLALLLSGVVHSTTGSMKKILIGTAVTGLLLLYYFFDARRENFFPVCPFWKLTGFYCPGCGSQRAVSALLRGDIASAFSFNLLVPLSIPFIIYGFYTEAKKSLSDKSEVRSFFYKPGFSKAVAIIVIAFFILRNIPLYPFTLLQPGGFSAISSTN